MSKFDLPAKLAAKVAELSKAETATGALTRATRPSMDATYKAIKRLDPEDLDLAISRAQSLPDFIDPTRYSPAAMARIAAMRPAAQRGFSESLVSSREPFAAGTMRPSEFLGRTPGLNAPSDLATIEKLKSLLQKQGVKELPALWVDQYPSDLIAQYEGRHRMAALKELYGDDPVLMSFLPGNQLKDATDIFGKPYSAVQGPLSLTAKDILSKGVKFGDSPVNLNTLWTR